MSTILHMLAWLVGVFMAVQMVAACYSLVDFPDQLRRYRWTVVGRIAGWFSGFAAIYWLLPASMEVSFVDGIQFLVIFHLLMIFAPNLLLLRGRLNADRKYRQYLEGRTNPER